MINSIQKSFRKRRKAKIAKIRSFHRDSETCRPRPHWFLRKVLFLTACRFVGLSTHFSILEIENEIILFMQ